MTVAVRPAKTFDVKGVRIPDSKLAREITELVRDTESPLLFHHSSRVYFWGALAGERRRLKYDPELLYAGAMFHDMGLTDAHSSPHERFEVDGANAARDFLRGRGIAQNDIETVWIAIALHTTPGIPQHMHSVVALLTAGVEMDVLGIAYSDYSDAERKAVLQHCGEFPRDPGRRYRARGPRPHSQGHFRPRSAARDDDGVTACGATGPSVRRPSVRGRAEFVSLSIKSAIKESEQLSHNGLGLVLGDIVATGVDPYDTHV
jgi:hypothetical protein